MELRHSFLLQSVEGVEGATDPWSIHRDGAYHSFDAVDGRSVWITIRGKDLLQQRIMDGSVIDLPVYRNVTGPDAAAAFEASLATHLINKVLYCWCQNWRWYVRGLEDHTQESLVSAEPAPFDSDLAARLPLSLPRNGVFLVIPMAATVSSNYIQRLRGGSCGARNRRFKGAVSDKRTTVLAPFLDRLINPNPYLLPSNP
jgi:hypothetical protein